MGAIFDDRFGDDSETKSKDDDDDDVRSAGPTMYMNIYIYSFVRLTCTSFSLSETRLTISRRAALSGFGLELYAASRIALSWVLHQLIRVSIDHGGVLFASGYTRRSLSLALGVFFRVGVVGGIARV